MCTPVPIRELHKNQRSDQIRSVAQSCPTLCYPMNRSTPGLPVHHQLPEFTQTHIHRVSDAIQPSHPLSSPSPPAPNPSQHQRLFQWVNSSHEVAKVLDLAVWNITLHKCQSGFPAGTSGKGPTCKCRRCKRCRFDPWVGKIPWNRAWKSTPVFLTGESHGQRGLVGNSP